MKIYKIAKINKFSSLGLYVKDYDRDYMFDNIHSLGWGLNSFLYNKVMDQRDKAYFSEFHKVPSSDTITMDGLDVDAPTGIINFYIDGIRPDRVDYMLDKLKEFLVSSGIKVGSFVKNQSKMYDVPVVRIPILENPKSLESGSQDTPPEISLSNDNAFFIFNKVLNFNRDLWEDRIFDAQELKTRIEYFEGENHLPEGENVGQGVMVSTFNPENPDAFDEENLSGRKGVSNYDEQDIRRLLKFIKSICEWAISHGYSKLYMG